MIKSRTALLGVVIFTSILGLFGNLTQTAYADKTQTIKCSDKAGTSISVTVPDNATDTTSIYNKACADAGYGGYTTSPDVTYVQCTGDNTVITVPSGTSDSDINKACIEQDHGEYVRQNGPCGSSTVFFIPAWYKGLQDSSCAFSPAYTDSVSNKTCVKGSTADCKPNISKTALLVGLNVLQAALVVVGYITIIFLIKGGFEYMLSTGDPGRITSAKGTIRNAVIGLVIAILAASIVNAIGGMIPGA